MVVQTSQNRRARASRGICTGYALGERHGLVCLAVVLLAFGLVAEGRSATPKATDLQELATVCRPIGAFVSGNTVLVGADEPVGRFDVGGASHPFPADARISAYEEHGQFLYALGAEKRPERAVFVRRFIYLKPDVFVVDDFVQPTAATPVRWQVGCRSEPKAVGRQVRLSAADQEFVGETLWPADSAFQSTATARESDATVFPFEATQEADSKGVRWLHVFQLRQRTDGDAAVTSSLENKDGQFELAITTPQRVFRLTLPPPGADAGWIAIQDATGKTLVPRRPLASGVLPHGPEGARLVERWDSAYRDGGKPGWDTGIVAPALKEAVESGAIKPCRAVDLGCGSGTNCIYLASRGFDVTGIDVAPTALGIADEKAAKAGVRVRWVLADVLALPELEPFDLVFDRGCYHHVRYVDAAGFLDSLRQLTRPGTRCLILSCNRDSPPGVREHHMRSDFSALFDFEWLRDSGVENRDGSVRRESWSLMLRRKD